MKCVSLARLKYISYNFLFLYISSLANSKETLSCRIRKVEVKNHPFCSSHIMAYLLAYLIGKDSNQDPPSISLIPEHVTFYDEGQ